MSRSLMSVVWCATLLFGSIGAAYAFAPVAVVPEPGANAMLAGGAVATVLFVLRLRARRR